MNTLQRKITVPGTLETVFAFRAQAIDRLFRHPDASRRDHRAGATLEDNSILLGEPN